jgi:hypothetical protein
MAIGQSGFWMEADGRDYGWPKADAEKKLRLF